MNDSNAFEQGVNLGSLVGIQVYENPYLAPKTIMVVRRDGVPAILCQQTFDVEQLLFRAEIKKIVREGLFAAYPSLRGVDS